MTSESYKAGRDWFAMVGPRESPLSGEWAGESIPEIEDSFGFERDTLDLDDFEQGFADAENELHLAQEWIRSHGGSQA